MRISSLRRPEWSRHGYALRSTHRGRESPKAAESLGTAAIAAAGLATAGAALALALANDDVSGIQIALLEWISVPYVAAGLVAWWRRPDSRLGLLMIAGGFATAAHRPAFADCRSAHVGAIFDVLPAALFLHVYLAFPDGRLRSRSSAGSSRRYVSGDRPAARQDGARRLRARQPAGGLDRARTPRRPSRGRSWSRSAPSASRDRRAGDAGGGAPAGRCGDPVALLVDSFALGLVMIAMLFVSGAFDGPPS